ncbi:MAG TPA: hypothetical protein VJJ47_01420 [Candidatus Paceibacterota bacterium]
MKDNTTYNLMLQLVEESKALWRIENEYLEDSGDDDEVRTFWEALAVDKEAHIADLRALVASRLAAESEDSTGSEVS